jgi:hypothetical protein
MFAPQLRGLVGERGMIAIILGTPFWVWPLLVYLVWNGWQATRRHEFRPLGSVVLPGVFLLVSLRSLLLGDEISMVAIIAWAVGAAAGAAVGWVMAMRVRTQPNGDLSALEVSGTWSVLIMSLAFFAIQYLIGYWRATQPELLGQAPLIAVVPLVSAAGTFFFVGRAAAFLKVLRG